MLIKKVKQIFIILILSMLYIANTYAYIVKDDFIISVCKERKYKRCDLVLAIIKVESLNKATSYNPDGSYGLMQVQCGTAQIFGLKNCNDLFYPRINIEMGIKYLEYLESKLEQPTVQNIISTYNTGPRVTCLEKNRFGGCRKLKLVPKTCPKDRIGPFRCAPGQYVNLDYIKKVSDRLNNLGLMD